MAIRRPRGLMDMASDFESEDCGFESHRGQTFLNVFISFVWRTVYSSKHCLKVLTTFTMTRDTSMFLRGNQSC